MDRVFLDANVLFSVAYREGAGLSKLWKLANVDLMTSAYAAEEAARNLDQREARERLSRLLARARLVPEGTAELPRDVHVHTKDRPILQAAIGAKATHLLTGDLRDFGSLFGTRVGGILIQTPADDLRRRRRSETGRPDRKHRPE